MSADSQPVEIRGGENRVQVVPGQRSRKAIIVRRAGGFVGLIGFAGTETIDGRRTVEWLSAFNGAHADADLDTFCDELAAELSEVWRRTGAETVLEILVAGERGGDLQFWYVRNSQGLLDLSWKHLDPSDSFMAMNDLDNNYIPNDLQPDETKDDVLARKMYSWRQGVLLPAAPVFDGFAGLMRELYARQGEGFVPLASLDDLGHFARVRMEFLKRLCTAKYGIFAEDTPATVGGDVHVLGVARNGRVREYTKGRNEVETLFEGRSS